MQQAIKKLNARIVVFTCTSDWWKP